jgi:hypothetical protein
LYTSSTVDFIYHWRDGEVWRNETLNLYLEYTDCHYGRKRPWILCPLCGEKKAVLYFSSGQWGCRRSLDLAYLSQSENFLDRLDRKKRKLALKLSSKNRRPRGMHKATYWFIMRELDDIEETQDRAINLRIARM